MIEVLLMLKVPLTQYPKIEDLFCRNASWSKTCLFFCDDCFGISWLTALYVSVPAALLCLVPSFLRSSHRFNVSSTTFFDCSRFA